MRRETNQMLHNSLLNLWFTQYVLGTIMPTIRSWRLYRYSQHVARNCKDGTLESVENSIVVRIVLSCVECVIQARVVYPVCRGGGVVAD